MAIQREAFSTLLLVSAVHYGTKRNKSEIEIVFTEQNDNALHKI